MHLTIWRLCRWSRSTSGSCRHERDRAAVTCTDGNKLTWDEVDRGRLDDGGDDDVLREMQLVARRPCDQRVQREAAVHRHANDTAFRLDRRNQASQLIACAQVVARRHFEDDVFGANTYEDRCG